MCNNIIYLKSFHALPYVPPASFHYIEQVTYNPSLPLKFLTVRCHHIRTSGMYHCRRHSKPQLEK
jgi:hypothetical protein